jgi:hypothetical protein
MVRSSKKDIYVSPKTRRWVQEIAALTQVGARIGISTEMRTASGREANKSQVRSEPGPDGV